MINLEDEIRQSRRAAEEMTAPQAADDGRTRSEMMARYSGGRKGILDFSTSSEPYKLWKTYRGKTNGEDDVYSGQTTPKEFFSQTPESVNYTGVGRKTHGMDDLRNAFRVTDYTSGFKNDFVSALYNGETPLEEIGVANINEGIRDVYRRILGKNYAHVTGENFRGYQLAPESLEFAPELDNLVRKGNYTQQRRDYNAEYERDWALDNTHFYDAGSHQMVVVDHGGKKYYKLVDVFDTKGTHSSRFLDKGVNDAIARYEKPYVVSTPWRELPSQDKKK